MSHIRVTPDQGPSEAMPDVTDITQLHDYLYKSMQLEHATLGPYLTALYSIDVGTNPDATQILRVVAVEEMLHLTLAANLLNAVGGQPDPTREGFVTPYPTMLPDGEDDFEVSLLPFGQEALDIFLKIERPRMAPSSDERHRPGPAVQDAIQLVHQYYSIGEFYRAIAEGIDYLENQARGSGQTIFTGDPDKQVTSEYYYSGGGELVSVSDLESAKAAIDLIIEQGEGETHNPYSADGELAHYYRFLQLRESRYYMPGDGPDNPSGPTFAVDWAAVQPVTPNLKVTDLIEGSELRLRVEDFNRCYADFLALLKRAFSGEPSVFLSAVPMMFQMRNAMTELCRNRIPGRTTNAGPTFEIP